MKALLTQLNLCKKNKF